MPSLVPLHRNSITLVVLAAAMVLMGLATYGFVILAIAGVLLPDWEFFDRDYSKWLTPMPASGHTATATAADREHNVWKYDSAAFPSLPLLYDLSPCSICLMV